MNRCTLPLLLAGLLVWGACANDHSKRVSQHDRRQFHVVMLSKLRQLDGGIGQLAGVAAANDSTFASRISLIKSSNERVREHLYAMEGASDRRWYELKDSVEVYYRIARDEYASVTRNDRAPVQADSSGVSAAARTN